MSRRIIRDVVNRGEIPGVIVFFLPSLTCRTSSVLRLFIIRSPLARKMYDYYYSFIRWGDWEKNKENEKYTYKLMYEIDPCLVLLEYCYLNRNGNKVTERFYGMN